MILIGQYDSPFVRRVGIAMTLYGLAYEHRPWSSFSDADKLRPLNPLTRVPTLMLDNGDVLVESHAMLDYLDRLVPEALRMFPVSEPERHRAMRIAGLATGLADKAVSLFYEKRLHQHVSDVWVKRCQAQMGGVLDVLEAERAAVTSAYWFGDRIGHADIAVGAALRFLSEAHTDILTPFAYPTLSAFAARLEALPAFQAIAQKFIPPA